jgi:carboxypeptidase Taq
VHWYCRRQSAAAFQGYTIGNILCAQLYAQRFAAHPEVPRQMASASSPRCTAGCATTSIGTGASSSPTISSTGATGGPMSIAPYIAYLRNKYGELYRLPPASKR